MLVTCLFKTWTTVVPVNNRNTRKWSEIRSKLTIKTPERHYWRRSGFFINFEHISHLFSSVFIVDFLKLFITLYCLKKNHEKDLNVTIWEKVFKDRPRKFIENSLLKIWSNMVCLKWPYHFNSYKGCFLQFLHRLLPITLSYIFLEDILRRVQEQMGEICSIH